MGFILMQVRRRGITSAIRQIMEEEAFGRNTAEPY
jgi:hypothetical protein